MEQLPAQFNQEAFKNEFKTLFSAYKNICWEFTKYTRHDNKNDDELEHLQTQVDQSMDKMVTLAVQALKMSKDKKSILDEVRRIFFDEASGNVLSPGEMTAPGKIENFFENVILHL